MNHANGPLVSVVIPTYNHARFLARALQSVLDQTYTNWEAIIVDNHSQDNTDQVVQRFEDARIALLKIHNGGVIAASRNLGIRAAKGEWIAFLDSDDFWTPNKLQVCFEHIDNRIDLVYHSLKIIRDDIVFYGRRTINSWQVKTPVIVDLLLNGNPIANSSVVVRKTLLDQVGGVDEGVEMIASEDYNTWLRIAQFTNAFYYIPQQLGAYLVHDASISKRDMSMSTRFACAEFMHLLNDQQKLRVESNLTFTRGQCLLSLKNFKSARSDFIFCMRHGNSFIRLKSLFMLIFSVSISR